MNDYEKEYNINKRGGGGYQAKERFSNLELLRIIAMLLIVAHHSVVNSGITDKFDFQTLSPNMIFLQLWGMWGKTAINVFVLITGYFMCTSKLTWKRFAKIYLEAKFYRIVIFLIFLVFGYEIVSAKSIFKVLFGYLYGIDSGFTASFFAFYLFIPFLNVWIEKLGKDIWKLNMLLLGMFTITSTFFFNSVVFHHVFWYMTLYMIAAGIRLYPAKWMQSKKITGFFLAVMVLISYVSVLAIDFICYYLKWNKGYGFAYYMISDSNKLLAFLVGLLAFLFFNNLKIKQSRIINKIATTTFGVLLIHANSNAMRKWLWQDFLNIPDMYELPFYQLVFMEILIMLLVFIVCSLIDMLRIHLVEKPVFQWINKNAEQIEKIWKNFWKKLKNVYYCVEDKLENYNCSE